MDWEKMPLTELRKSAKERGIKNYSLMKKQELIDKLNSLAFLESRNYKVNLSKDLDDDQKREEIKNKLKEQKIAANLDSGEVAEGVVEV